MSTARGSTRFLHSLLLFLPMLAGLPGHAVAMEEADLQRRLALRLQQDPGRTCLAAAVVDATRVTQAYVCNPARKPHAIDAHTAFEVGSISKTMTAALLADLIRQGKASLDAPLATYLPPGTPVPNFQGQPILLRHVVTHSSGLPAQASRMAPSDPSDPYATFDAVRLLGSLEDVQLKQAPGNAFEYSTFGYMLLSYIVARLAGQDFEKQARQVLFDPMAMHGAYIAAPPDGIRKAMGHVEGRPVREWTFPVNVAGTGGVRATLPDMVRYLQAQMGLLVVPATPALEMTHQSLGNEPEIGMAWFVTRLGNRVLYNHDGGTGGFTSVMMFDRANQRGTVILADNNWTPVERMNALAVHLLDLGPLPMPRRDKASHPPPAAKQKVTMR